MAEDRILLPKNVRPVHYRVHLTPSFETFKFDGKVDVQVEVNEATKTIVVNALDLEVSLAVVTYESGMAKLSLRFALRRSLTP